MSRLVRAKISIMGTRTLLQHCFGPDAIPLEKGERTGVAGNDPDEWKKTCMMNEDRMLYLPGTYIFSCLKNGAIHTRRGRSSLQAPLVSTLQVEEDQIKINRVCPEENELQKYSVLTPPDPEVLTFIYVTSVRNPTTKGRNVRYRLATIEGWKSHFTLVWDKTVISREQMKAILHDSGVLGGLGDGIRIGCGRFEVIKYKELDDAEKTATKGDMESNERSSMDKGQKKMR